MKKVILLSVLVSIGFISSVFNYLGNNFFSPNIFFESEIQEQLSAPEFDDNFSKKDINNNTGSQQKTDISNNYHISEPIDIQDTKHLKTPNSVKSIYYTAYATSSKNKLNKLIDLAKNKEINSVTIDVKEVDGYVSFKMDDNYFGNIKPKSNLRIKNIEDIIKKLHENNIYVIARIVVFKDKRLAETRPDLAIKWNDKNSVWYDYKGNKYLDPYSKEVWDYNLNLARYSWQLGFDEINLDYIRFPTDGYISKTYYPFASDVISKNPKWGKIMVIDQFSNYINTNLKSEFPNSVTSADIFGLVTSNDGFNIGQNLESFLINFDYIGPMTYPSHYAPGFLGFSHPDNYPYAIIKDALDNVSDKISILNGNIDTQRSLASSGSLNSFFEVKDGFFTSKSFDEIKKARKSQVRLWIQGFSCTWCKGYIPYNRTRFREQINAINDSGFTGWWVWNSASNYYDSWYDKD